MKDHEPATRVVTVSGKDRSAITMAGHSADGVFWYEDNFGFTTYLTTGEEAAANAPLAKLFRPIYCCPDPASVSVRKFFQRRSLGDRKSVV